MLPHLIWLVLYLYPHFLDHQILNKLKKPTLIKMEVIQIPEIVLESSNGRRTMPVLAFGTASNNQQPEVLIEAVLEAIKLGYRHLDTASLYGSEQSLGQAIAKTLDLGLVASRDELFVTSKLWANDAHPGLVIPALKKSLENLGLEYLDLYLIHWPLSATPGELSGFEKPIDEKDQMPIDYKGRYGGSSKTWTHQSSKNCVNLFFLRAARRASNC